MSEEPQSRESQNKEPQSAQPQKEPTKKTKPVAAGNKSAKVRLNKQKVQLQSLDKDKKLSNQYNTRTSRDYTECFTIA